MGFWWSWVKPRATVTTELSLQARLERARAATRAQLETGSQQKPGELALRA